MNKLEKALENFSSKKILVIGDIMLDKFSWGEINRINPEQPAAPLLKIFKEDYILGGAANTANNIASLGAEVYLSGVIGNDLYGKKLEEICNKNGIKHHFCYLNNPTIVKERGMAHGQQVVRLDYGEQNLKKINSKTKEKLLNKIKNIKNLNGIILSDYNKIIFQKNFTQEIINYAKLQNIPIIADPKPQNINYFKSCDLICPNKIEAEKITGIKYRKENGTLLEIGRKLSNRLNSNTIITLGEDGIFIYGKDGKSQYVQTEAKEVVDVTGAGDTFIATLSLSLASNLNIHDASSLANLASGIVVEKSGTSTPTIKEMKNRLKSNRKI
jgi:D-glycero-beta-D-manno-heptose-7-phosphate kinase